MLFALGLLSGVGLSIVILLVEFFLLESSEKPLTQHLKDLTKKKEVGFVGQADETMEEAENLFFGDDV